MNYFHKWNITKVIFIVKLFVVSRLDKHRKKAEEDIREEQRLARERSEIESRLA